VRFLAPRLIPLGVTLVIVQVALFPQLRLFEVVPDLGLVAAVAVAYRHGPEVGAWFGFAVGFGYDLFLNTPMGLSALAYALCAYLVGSIERGLLRRGRWLPSFLGLLAGIVGGGCFLLVGALAGAEELATTEAIAIQAKVALYGAVVAPLAFAVVNLVLRDDRPAWTLRD
jgi:rod shape-determining protein MreD